MLGLWGASGASSALGAQYMIQGLQLVATGGMMAPPGPYMQSYKNVAEAANWALDPRALAGTQQPSQADDSSPPTVLSMTTQAAADWFQVGAGGPWLHTRYRSCMAVPPLSLYLSALMPISCTCPFCQHYNTDCL